MMSRFRRQAPASLALRTRSRIVVWPVPLTIPIQVAPRLERGPRSAKCIKPLAILFMETKNSEGGIGYAQPSACMLSPILGTEECAVLLRCSTDQVEHLAASAKLPAYKFGRSWVFHRDLLISAVGDLCAARYLARQPNPDFAAMKTGIVPSVCQPARTEPSSSSLPVVEPETKRPRGRPRIRVVIPD